MVLPAQLSWLAGQLADFLVNFKNNKLKSHKFLGELVARAFPNGMRDDQINFVHPGLYAVVGASALCGGFTHSISIAIIAFEMTGQLVSMYAKNKQKRFSTEFDEIFGLN